MCLEREHDSRKKPQIEGVSVAQNDLSSLEIRSFKDPQENGGDVQPKGMLAGGRGLSDQSREAISRVERPRGLQLHRGNGENLQQKLQVSKLGRRGNTLTGEEGRRTLFS